LNKDFLRCGGIFDLDVKELKVKELEIRMGDSQFWDDGGSAQKVIEELNALKLWTTPYGQVKSKFKDIQELLLEEEVIADEALFAELLLDLDVVDKNLSEMEVRRMLSGELDSKECYLEINAGAGGTESCDWASMLGRMYQRWATKKGWDVAIIDRQEGDVVGFKSITFHFKGMFAYGYCKSEKGVHRLVRISPFDSNAKRHTSFASVAVTPIIDDVQVDIRTEDIRVDTYRAQGAGGQHVNKTDSAVRMTHIPSGIVVSCQAERSQIQNRETCMKMLNSKLYEKEYTEQQEKLAALGGEKKENAWGSQIRNYVFQPYTLVKDTRTKLEKGNVQAVMDGDIDDFINAYLREFG
jgi:peptide chain release factor 2